jgi:hypothetical protein
VGAHSFEVITLGNKVGAGVGDCSVDKGSDVGCDNMDTGAGLTQGGCHVESLGEDTSNSASECLYWAKPGRRCSAVNRHTTLSVLLVVVQVEGPGVGQDELGKRGSVG